MGSVLVAFWKSAYSDRSGPLETAMHSAFSSATFLWLEVAVYQMMLFLRALNNPDQLSGLAAVHWVAWDGLTAKT